MFSMDSSADLTMAKESISELGYRSIERKRRKGVREMKPSIHRLRDSIKT